MQKAKKVFVIDSLYSLYSVDPCELSNSNTHFVIEKKIGLRSNDVLFDLLKIYLHSHSASVNTVITISPYLLLARGFAAFRIFLLACRKVYNLLFLTPYLRLKYGTTAIYIGAFTSSIIRMLPSCRRIVFFHGYGEIHESIFHAREKDYQVSDFFKSLLFDLNEIDYMKQRSLSMIDLPSQRCRLVPDINPLISFLSFHQPDVLDLLHSKLNFSSLNLLLVPWEVSSTFRESLSRSENAAEDIIVSLKPAKEVPLLIKYHRAAYYESFDFQKSLVSRLISLGYQVIDFDALIPIHLQGEIPCELILSIIGDINLLCVESAAALNFAFKGQEVFLSDNSKYLSLSSKKNLNLLLRILNKLKLPYFYYS